MIKLILREGLVKLRRAAIWNRGQKPKSEEVDEREKKSSTLKTPMLKLLYWARG